MCVLASENEAELRVLLLNLMPQVAIKEKFIEIFYYGECCISSQTLAR